MGADLRTSARDLLTLAQKASTLLQRKSDRILAEIEDANVSLAPDVEAMRSEQCQQAIDLRRNVWETSKRLKGALEHVEDIEDEDEPRILREPMEELQKLVREALNITSDPEARALLQSNRNVPKGGSTNISASKPDSSRSLPIPAGIVSGSGPMMMPGTPPLTGSVHRHPLGIFSTSPKFTAQSPFSSPGRASATRLSMLTDMVSEDPLSSPLASPTPTQKSPKAVLSTLKPSMTSTLTSVSDGPLSICTTTIATAASVAKGIQPDHSWNSAATSSSLSSTASFSTPITSPLDAPCSPPTASTFKSRQSVEQESKTSPRTETLPSPPQQRRVPRGLFSPSSVLQESRKVEQHPVAHPESSASWLNSSIAGQGTVTAEESIPTAPNHLHSHSAAVDERGDSLIARAAAVTPPPLPQPDSLYSEPRSPTSPKLHRAQARPLPIQTASPAAHHTPKSRTRPDKSEEEISQLARDLERAMNPTPTDPLPQLYFLQGKGLLQRIPSQVSMDDGLLNEEQNDNLPSEESEDFEDQDGLQRGSGSLRRQQSGGRRRFRFARSRSRNRSRVRGEARNKPALVPIDIGSSGTLASSAWPFDHPPPALLSVNALEQQRRQGRSVSRSRSRSRRPSASSPQPQPPSAHESQRHTCAGPHLPFADSVTIGNPIRIGRGIGSFTVYTVALTLCDPATGANTVSALSLQESRQTDARNQQQQQQDTLQSSQRRLVDFANGANSAHAGHVTDPLGVERTEPKPPSMASLMMTRSLSFPGLGPSAERLLMDIQPLPETQSTPSGASAAPLGLGSGPESSSGVPLAPKRVIQVRKRYSDFVTLRSQLVETFKDRRRSRVDNSGGGSGSYQRSQHHRLFSASTSTSTPSSFSTVDQPRYHPTRTQSLGSYQENEDDEEGDPEDDHDSYDDDQNTRPLPTSATLATAMPQNSIIRGLPKLPPKRVVGKFRPAFVEKRRRELEYFLEWVVAHPIMGDCPVVVQWFLGPSTSTV